MPNYNYPYTPQFYQPQGPVMQPNIPQPMIQQQQQQQNTVPQIQNGGFMLVPSEEFVRNYPVAPGNCVTFKIEGKPIVMEKAMGFSQLETPKIDKYRLVKEEPTSEQKAPEVKQRNEEIDSIKSDLRIIRGEVNEIREALFKRNNQQRRDKNGES